MRAFHGITSAVNASPISSLDHGSRTRKEPGSAPRSTDGFRPSHGRSNIHYSFDRRFIFRVLAVRSNSRVSGARRTRQLRVRRWNQAFSKAEDWIQAGRCRQVVIVSADNVTSDDLMGWIGSGFLASGAAQPPAEEVVRKSPFRSTVGDTVSCSAWVRLQWSSNAPMPPRRGVRRSARSWARRRTALFTGPVSKKEKKKERITCPREEMLRQVEGPLRPRSRQLAGDRVVRHGTYAGPRRQRSNRGAALRRVFGHAADRIVIARHEGHDRSRDGRSIGMP